MNPEVEIQEQNLQIEDLSIRFATVSNMEALFDALIKKGKDHADFKDERIPYWADLWPSAIGLSQHMVRHKLIKPGDRVLELGCGLGLVGVVAGKMGAEVHFTDYIQDALDMASRNWDLNDIPGEATFSILDWREPAGNFQPDWILAADVAYEKRILQPLLDTILHFKGPNTKVLLTEPGRQIGQAFFELLEKSELQTSESSMIVTLKGIETRVGIWEIG